MVTFGPGFLNLYSEKRQSFFRTPYGLDYVKKFLFVKGNHHMIIGNTGGGKTQKGYFHVENLSKLETIVWIDAGKNDEFLPLLDFGKPVRIIHPVGVDIQVRNLPSNIYLDTVGIVYANDAWNHVKKNWINIMMFRNTIADEKIRAEWMIDVFSTLSERTRRKTLKWIYPCTIVIDEAQWLIGSKRVSTKHHRIALAEEVTENALEIRAYGGRLVMITQGYRNVSGGSRENMPTMTLCRGCKREWFDNEPYKKYADYSTRYRPEQGLFVFSDGAINPTTCPWQFPFYQPQHDGLIIQPSGFWDEQPEEKEDAREMVPDMGRWSAVVPIRSDPMPGRYDVQEET